METYDSPQMTIRKVNVGPYDNNVYVLICKETNESVIIDASFEVPNILAAAGDSRVRYILQTHCHIDHVAGMDELKTATQAPVGIHPQDEEQFSIRGDFQLEDGVPIQFGACEIEVIHTPGHSRGGISFTYGAHCFCGDTVFPGGPGKTWSADDFQTLLHSIATRLYTLPDATVLYPGHGLITDVGASKQEYEIFQSKPRSKDVYGDVLWRES